ncbi:Gpi16 subunit, GPI transamidase component-domain-containing protein [Lactarius hengduanensis]|nr:Gpi16 subunit, GPI transamidase component-domain-containing protein [Lactarius hengduanensis]
MPPRPSRFLVDGKLAARFSFSTLLCSAVPSLRDPSEQFGHRSSFQPSTTPSFPYPSGRSYENTRYRDYDRWGHHWDTPTLQNSLLGLFCASLGSMDALHTTSPAHAYLPTGDLPRLPTPARDAYTLYYATLPAGRMCTENLKLFLKFLPCPSRASVAALLDPRTFDVESPTGMRSNIGMKTTPTAATAKTSLDDHDVDNSEDDLYSGNCEDDTIADGHNDQGVTAEAAMTSHGISGDDDHNSATTRC